MGKKKEIVVSEPVKNVEAPEKKALKKVKLTKKQKRIRGKAYLMAKNKYLNQKTFPIAEAIKILKQISYEKFNAAVELHLNLSEKNLKGEVTLPHGTGKTLKITVFDEEVEKELQNNQISFDILIAQAKDMPKLVKFAKLLGPKGLMPSPKKGTLTDDPKKAVTKLGSGTMHFKSEAKFPLLHQVIGRRDFTEKQLLENFKAFIRAVNLKYIQAAFVKTSMSPAVRIQLDSLE